MNDVEFRRQIFRDAAQWQHGLSYRLRAWETGGFALFSRPSFTELTMQTDEARAVTSLAVDRSGQVFWLHRHNCYLYVYDPLNRGSEAIIPVGDCEARRDHSFGRMISVKGRLWILDRTNSRVLCLRTDTFQIIAEISLFEPIDVALSSDRLFALDRNGLSIYEVNGNLLSLAHGDHLWQP